MPCVRATTNARSLSRGFPLALCRGRSRSAGHAAIATTIIQISPPLVAGEAEMDEIVGILGEVLAEASARML